MRTRRALLTLLVALPLLGGCLGRALPVPPPTATIQSITQCPMLDCPEGGLVVTLTGTANARALVTALDEEAPRGPDGEYLSGVAMANELGRWSITLAPRQFTPGTVSAVQPGHSIRVFQVTADGDASSSFYVSVPRM